MRTATNPQTFARKLLRVAFNPRDRSDRELLAQFASGRDEDAFAELVRRHGRMVLAVARRVTRSQQDAEDAFQAAFLVLARRASHIKQPEQLANWLYGVAYRTALEARAARRRVLEHPVSAIPETAAPDPADDGSELRRVIDEELAHLPEKYRAVVVLCELEGLSRAEAATRLKIPEGTLSSRLAYARKVLANRLSRRGINCTAGAIAALLSAEATGIALPEVLVYHTARVAARATPGGVVPPDLVSPSVSHLTERVMKIMLANRLRLSITAGVLACGLIALGAIGLAQQPNPQSVQLPTGSNTQNRYPNKQNNSLVKDAPKIPIPAKGIEDEDVPYGALPMQAVVRIEENKLIIRKRVAVSEPVMHQVGNQKVTNYEYRTEVSGMAINDASDIAVFDMKGNRLLPKAWKDKLKVDVHVLMGFDGKLPNPRELTLFKEDTLLLILPANSALNAVPHAPALPVAQYYPPVTPGVPQTTYVPSTTIPSSNSPTPYFEPTQPEIREVLPPAVNTLPPDPIATPPVQSPAVNTLPPDPVATPPVPSQVAPTPTPAQPTRPANGTTSPRPASTPPPSITPQPTQPGRPPTQAVPATPPLVSKELVSPPVENETTPTNR